MNILKGVLFIIAALFIVSGLFIFLPWTTINGLMATFGAPVYPPDGIVQYTVRVFFLVIFWSGVLLALAVREPVKLQAVLVVMAGLCLSCAVACLVLGWLYALPPFFYADAISSAVIGVLILMYRQRALAASAGAGTGG